MRPVGEVVATAFADAVVTVVVSALFYRLGGKFYGRFLCREGEVRYITVRRLFSLSFCASFALYILMMFELIGIMHAQSRRLIWRTVLSLHLILLLFVLPVSQAFYILVDRGNGWRYAVRGAVMAELVYLLLLWRIADPFPVVANRNKASGILTLVSMEHGLGRILVIGTAMLASISGITTVNLPFEYIYSFLRPVTRVEKQKHEDRVLGFLMELRQREEELAIQDCLRRVQTSSNSQAPTLDATSRGANEDAISSHSASSSQGASERPSFRYRMRRVYSEVILGDKLREEQTEKPSAERQLREEFLVYNDIAIAWHHQIFSRTPLGILSTLFGWCLLTFCIIRVSAAIGSITLARRSVVISEDPAMSKLDSIFQHIGLEVDPTIVSQVLTFLFTTFVIVINVRAVLLRLTKLFSFVSANTAMSGTAAVFLAQLMAAYFLSSVILLRGRLPAGYRSTITEALGDLEYNFYQRWFDIIFLLSAVGGILLILLQSKRRISSY